MKNEDAQNQHGTDSTEDRISDGNRHKNQKTNISTTQENNIAPQAGLGRDRMTDIEDSGDIIRGNDYAGRDNDDLTNENLNASNDQ